MRVFFDRLFLWFSFKFATCFNFCDLLQFLFPFLGILVIQFILHILVIQFHFFQFLLCTLNRVKPTVMPPRVTPICRGTMMTWNRSVNSVNTGFNSVAPDLQRRRQWIMIWHDFLRSVLQNSSVIFGDSFRLFQGLVDASHELGVMVVVGFDDEIEAVVWCLLVEMMDLSSVRS